MEEIELIHETIMEEEGLKVSDLPENIQKTIRSFKMHYGKAKKNPDDEALRNRVQEMSIRIGDDIQNFVEQDLPEEGDSNDGADDGKNPKGSQKQESSDGNGEASKSKKEAASNGDGDGEGYREGYREDRRRAQRIPTPNTRTNTQSGIFGTPAMAKKITTICRSNGNRINTSELASIIGKEPDHPMQRVHNLKLRKVLFASKYRIV